MSKGEDVKGWSIAVSVTQSLWRHVDHRPGQLTGSHVNYVGFSMSVIFGCREEVRRMFLAVKFPWMTEGSLLWR